MRHFSICLLILFLFACNTSNKVTQTTTTTTLTTSETAPNIDFVILQLNDVYEISPLDEGRLGGMSRVATVKKQLLKANPNLITVLAGDYLNPSLIGSLKCEFEEGKDRVNGRQMVDVMNALGVDYVALGNHEFDLKEKDLIKRNEESKFKIISANVLNKTESGEKPFQQFGADIPGHLVHTFKGADGSELKLGLMSVVLPSNPKKYVTYLDHFELGEKAFEAAKKESDIVFGLTHLTLGMDKTLAGKVSEMPLILGGHEHVNMIHNVGNTTIAKADANAKTVYIHWCTYNPNTKKVDIWSQLFPINDVIDPDPEVEKVVAKWEKFAEDCMTSQGYNPDDTISFNLTPLDGREVTIRSSQTNLGKAIASALEAAAPQADAAFFNSGSIRLDDYIKGFVKQRDILGTLPFGGELTIGPIKGDMLKKILDIGLAEGIKGNGAYLQLGSIEPKGGSYLIKGEKLDVAKTYQIALPSFLAGGGESALSFIKDAGPFELVDISALKSSGLQKNDLRDIVIWSMKNGDKMKLVKELMNSEK